MGTAMRKETTEGAGGVDFSLGYPSEEQILARTGVRPETAHTIYLERTMPFTPFTVFSNLGEYHFSGHPYLGVGVRLFPTVNLTNREISLLVEQTPGYTQYYDPYPDPDRKFIEVMRILRDTQAYRFMEDLTFDPREYGQGEKEAEMIFAQALSQAMCDISGQDHIASFHRSAQALAKRVPLNDFSSKFMSLTPLDMLHQLLFVGTFYESQGEIMWNRVTHRRVIRQALHYFSAFESGDNFIKPVYTQERLGALIHHLTAPNGGVNPYMIAHILKDMCRTTDFVMNHGPWPFPERSVSVIDQASKEVQVAVGMLPPPR